MTTTTRRASANRETHSREVCETYSRKFAEAATLSGRLFRCIYYLVLYRRTSTFGEEDYDTPEGCTWLRKVLLDMLYERLERRSRIAEVSCRLREHGVAEAVVDECLKDLF